MAGTSNLTSGQSVLYGDNASFDGTERGGILSADGEFWVGSGTGTPVRKGTLTASSGSSATYTKPTGSTGLYTVKSPPYSDVGITGTSIANTGEFITATVTRTLPATAGLVDGDLVEYVCTTANVLTITANTGQAIRRGNVVTGVAGTATSSAIGDSIRLRFRAADQIWYATGSEGVWVLSQ